MLEHSNPSLAVVTPHSALAHPTEGKVRIREVHDRSVDRHSTGCRASEDVGDNALVLGEYVESKRMGVGVDVRDRLIGG